MPPLNWSPINRWAEHPDYCIADWTGDVLDGFTRQGYIEWVNIQLSQLYEETN